jgi:hypothetical protein
VSEQYCEHEWVDGLGICVNCRNAISMAQYRLYAGSDKGRDAKRLASDARLPCKGSSGGSVMQQERERRMTIAETADLIRTGFIPSNKLTEGGVLIAAVNEVSEGLEAQLQAVTQRLNGCEASNRELETALIIARASVQEWIDYWSVREQPSVVAAFRKDIERIDAALIAGKLDTR